jgi:hypothetical protein
MATKLSATEITFNDNSSQVVSNAPMRFTERGNLPSTINRVYPPATLGVGFIGVFPCTIGGGPYFCGDSISGSYIYRYLTDIVGDPPIYSLRMNRTYYKQAATWRYGNYTDYTSTSTNLNFGVVEFYTGGGPAQCVHVFNCPGTWRILGSWPTPVPSWDPYYGHTTLWSNLFTRLI